MGMWGVGEDDTKGRVSLTTTIRLHAFDLPIDFAPKKMPIAGETMRSSFSPIWMQKKKPKLSS